MVMLFKGDKYFLFGSAIGSVGTSKWIDRSIENEELNVGLLF